jgi:hypothetical protein
MFVVKSPANRDLLAAAWWRFRRQEASNLAHWRYRLPSIRFGHRWLAVFCSNPFVNDNCRRKDSNDNKISKESIFLRVLQPFGSFNLPR